VDKGESPKTTGISDITGKIIRVRHANEYDMDFIEEMLKKHQLDAEDLHYTQFVIATENGTPIGCGRLKKMGEVYEIACIIVVEKKKGQGIGSLIVKHLIDYAPLNTVYVVTDKIDYYKKLGFVEVQTKVKEIENSLVSACRMSNKKQVIMFYEKIKD